MFHFLYRKIPIISHSKSKPSRKLISPLREGTFLIGGRGPGYFRNFKTKHCPSTQECIHEGLSRFCWDLPRMPALRCSSRHFTHFAIYQIIFGVGNFSRGFFVCIEHECSIFVSVLFCFYLKRSPLIPVISLSASLCSTQKLIKYSKPNAVWARRNAFMRDFPYFVEIYPVCQPSAVLPDISLISLFIWSYLELTIFREDFLSVARVNVRFLWVFYFVFICCYKLNSPHYVMRASPGLFSLGAFPTSRSHDFRHGCCMLNPVREGEEDWSDSLPSLLENFWKFLVKIA